MSSVPRGDAQTLFHEALGREPAGREAFIDQACAGDVQLRAQVLMLLDAHRTGFESGSSLETGSVLLSPDLVASAERRVGPYIIREEIGRGGMGVVYLADDTRLSRRLALKTLPSDLSRDSVRRERLRIEARAAAMLTHPGIATVYALEEWNGGLYLAVEYVPGQTLRKLLETSRPALGEVIEIAVQIAQALAVAHGQGVVHRDLKPENIMKTPVGLVKVLDFGVARVESMGSPHPTQAGTIVGTPGYMSPEQVDGRPVDFRSDQFSFGVLLYEMVTGSNPFDGDSVTTTITRILTMDPPLLSKMGVVSPPALDRLVSRCLAKDPAQRYHSTQLLATDLEQLRNKAAAVQSVPTRPRTAASSLAPPVTKARWWWQFHHVVATLLFTGMIYPAWRFRALLDPRLGLAVLLAIVASAAATTSLRLNLIFTAKHYPNVFTAHRIRSTPWMRAGDIVFLVALMCAAFDLGGRRPELAAALVGLCVVTAVSAFIIEPTTTRAAFPVRPGTARGPGKPRAKSGKLARPLSGEP